MNGDIRHVRKKKGTVIRVILSIFLMITLILFISIGAIYSKLNGIQKNSISVTDQAVIKKQAAANPYSKIQGITNILIIGSDARTGDPNGHSDAIFIATIDTVHNKVKLTSINRDSYVKNLKDGMNNQKITNVMYLGGTNGVGDLEYAIQGNFGISIDGYVKLNFAGLMDLVDALGGVQVDMTTIYNNKRNLRELNLFIQNPADNEPFKKADLITSPGIQTLNGTQALAYSRIRETDTTYARIDREDQIIEAIVQKVENASITQYPGILSTFSQYVTTDIPTTRLLSLAYTAVNVKKAAANDAATKTSTSTSTTGTTSSDGTTTGTANSNNTTAGATSSNSGTTGTATSNGTTTTGTSSTGSKTNSTVDPNSVVTSVDGIEKLQTPYQELCMDESIYGAKAFFSPKNGTWNLPFDIEQNKKALQNYIYNDIVFDPTQVNKSSIRTSMENYIYGYN